MSVQANTRLLSIDVLRGITIAAMILVSNPGTWDYYYAPLGHAPWHNITPTDVVFPCFVYIMGVSIFISFSKRGGALNTGSAIKIFKRTLSLLLIGAALIWFSVFCWRLATFGDSTPILVRIAQSFFCLDHFPVTGVLARLGICYCIASFVTLTVPHRFFPYIIATILIAYFIVLYYGNGFALERTSILSITDYAVLGDEYMEERIIDAEGILSTFPAVAHTLIGVCCGKIIMNGDTLRDKIISLFVIGTLMTISGLIFQYACPINKLIWSPTFVLTTCGIASLILAVLIYRIDIRQDKRPFRFFEVFGVNPLFLYVISHIIADLLDNISILYNGASRSIHEIAYWQWLYPVFGGKFGSLLYAVAFVSLIWAIGLVLYKKRIYIKI